MELHPQTAPAPTAAAVYNPGGWAMSNAPVTAGGHPVGGPLPVPLPCSVPQQRAASATERLPGSPPSYRAVATGTTADAPVMTPASRCGGSSDHTNSAFGSVVSSGFGAGTSPLGGSFHSPPRGVPAMGQPIRSPTSFQPIGSLASFLPALESPLEPPADEARSESVAQPGMHMRASSLGDQPVPADLEGLDYSSPEVSPGGTAALAGSRWSDEERPAIDHPGDTDLEAESGDPLTRVQLAYTANEVSVELYGSAPSALESSHDWGGRAASPAPVPQSPTHRGAFGFPATSEHDPEAYPSTGNWLPAPSGSGGALAEAKPVPVPGSGGISSMGFPDDAAEATPTSQGYQAASAALPQGSPYFSAESRASADGARRAALASSEALHAGSPSRQGPPGRSAGQQALLRTALLQSPGESVSGESSTPMSTSDMVSCACCTTTLIQHSARRIHVRQAVKDLRCLQL